MMKYNLYLISMALIQTVLPNHIVLHATLLFIDFYKVFDSIKIEKLDRYYWHMVSPKKLLPLWRCFKKTRKQCCPHLMATGTIFVFVAAIYGATYASPVVNRDQLMTLWGDFYLSAELWSLYSTATNISFLGITCCLPWPTDDPVERSFTFLQSCGHRILLPLTFPS